MAREATATAVVARRRRARRQLAEPRELRSPPAVEVARIAPLQVEDVGLRYPALDQDQNGVLEEDTAASPLVQEDQDGCLPDPTKLLLQITLPQFLQPDPRLKSCPQALVFGFGFFKSRRSKYFVLAGKTPPGNIRCQLCAECWWGRDWQKVFFSFTRILICPALFSRT